MAFFVIVGVAFLAFLAFTGEEAHKAFLAFSWLVMAGFLLFETGRLILSWL